jgi:hypothetical protein
MIAEHFDVFVITSSFYQTNTPTFIFTDGVAH